MHTGRSLASSTVTISQDDQIITRSLALLSAAEPDVIRHADSPRTASHPDDVAGDLRVNGAWEAGIVGAVDVNDPELVGPPELDVWARFVGAPDDPAIDQALLAFSTETFLIGTAMRPHAGVGQSQAHVTLSTGVLTHTMTYHEPCPPRSGTSSRCGPPTPGTAAATDGATSSTSTASWSGRSSRTP